MPLFFFFFPRAGAGAGVGPSRCCLAFSSVKRVRRPLQRVARCAYAVTRGCRVNVYPTGPVWVGLDTAGGEDWMSQAEWGYT